MTLHARYAFWYIFFFAVRSCRDTSQEAFRRYGIPQD